MAEAIRGFKSLNAELPKAIIKVARETVKNPVLVEARRRWKGQRIRPSQATNAIRASATAKGAGLILRGSAHPYAWGVEKGSRRYAQFRPWKGKGLGIKPGTDLGYVIQPAIRDTLPEVADRWATDTEATITEALRNG